jgi:hypothetical protein
MFLLFALIVLINALADNERVILYYRYTVAGLPINMLDLGLGLMFIAAVATMSRPKFLTERTHPMLRWSIGILSVSVLFGVLGALRNDVDLRYWVTIARNVVTLPLCIFLGYHLIRTPRYAWWASYIVVLGSLGSAIFVLMFVRETGEALSSFDRLRATSHGGDAGLWAMAFLAFTVVAGVKFLPMWVSLPLIPFTAICFFSLPHRSGWLTGAATLIFATAMLPRARFGRRVLMSTLVGTGLVVSMVMAVGAYSRLTGKDFGEYISQRLQTLLPGEEGVSKKAWDTRLPGAKRELEIWMQNPLMGQGFGIQMEEEQTGMSTGAGGMRHNVWTASLAESGIFGLLGYTLPPIAAMVLGYRLVRQSPDKGMLYIGALGAVVGFSALLYSVMTLSINVQRHAMPLGLICGMVFRCRAIQLAMAQQSYGFWEPDQPGVGMLEPDALY